MICHNSTISFDVIYCDGCNEVVWHRGQSIKGKCMSCSCTDFNPMVTSSDKTAIENLDSGWFGEDWPICYSFKKAYICDINRNVIECSGDRHDV